MAVTKVLARGWTLTVGAGLVAVGGTNSLTFSGGKTDAETTTFDSAGWAEHIVAERTRSIGVEGFFLEDPANGDRNAGQEAMETLASAVGADSIDEFVLTSPGGTTYSFDGSVEIGDIGGGNNDPTSWSATITVTGEITKV